MQAIYSIKYQLITMRDWVGYEGRGYSEENKEEWKKGPTPNELIR